MANLFRCVIGYDFAGIDAVGKPSEMSPQLPNFCFRSCLSRTRMSPILWIPNRWSRCCPTRPTPHSREVGKGSRNAMTPSLGTWTNPSGLSRSLAILATNFKSATPTLAVKSNSSLIACLIVPRSLRRRRATVLTRLRPRMLHQATVVGPTA